MQRFAFTSVLLLIAHFCLQAQNDVLDQLGKMAGDRIAEKGTDERARLDSVDFQYAISINEGAGFFDIQQKGETKSKLMYGFKEEAQKTTLEKARDTLEIGIGLYNIRRYELAELTIEGTKSLMEREGLQEEIVYLRVLSNLGLIYMTQGKLSQAKELIFNALENAYEKLGKESPAYIANLNNYAKWHQLMGKYTEAEGFWEDALRLSNQIFGASMQQAILLNNKAMLLQTLGQYEKAAQVMNEAIEMSKAAPKKFLAGKKSFDNRKFKANLAILFQASGDYENAEKLFKELKEVSEKRRQTKNAEYAALLHQMGNLYVQMDKMDKVRGYYVGSLNVYKKRWGENNIYFAKTASSLGDFHRRMKQYDEAETWLTKAFTIRKKLLNTNHPEYIKTQEALAILYWKTGRHEKAYTEYKDVMDKTIKVVDEFFPAMSEAEKTLFWDVTSPRFQRFYNFALDSYQQIPSVIEDVYQYNMTTKGLLLSTTTKARNTILNSGNDQLIAQYKSWLDKKEQLARLFSYSKGKLKSQQIDLGKLEQEINSIEKNLSIQSSVFSNNSSLKDYDFGLVQQLLNDDEVVVDLIRVQNFDQVFTHEVKYIALILDKQSSIPEIISINNGNELETRQLKYYRSSIKFKQDDNLSFSKYWASIENRIAHKKRVFFSPDGVYNQININTLKTDSGEFVISLHDVVLIGNSRDIIESKEQVIDLQKKSAFLVGYPNYGTPTIDLLPGTQVEIEGISKILSANGYLTNKFLENDASETQLKTVSNPMVLHIATHGYFKEDEQDESTLNAVYENASNNPLLKSGLILAGVGKALADTTKADIALNDNGILTAYEAMNLDLSETQLVVLSACETGLGEVKSGEGVYGLQRAFQVAGSDALVMSLWKVNDEATQKLMTNFYTQWATTGNKHAAFHQAQITLMDEYKDPYYWGAFVMIGD